MNDQAKMLGQKTPWGRIAAVPPPGWPAPGGTLGERYYMMVDKHGSVSLQPADLVDKYLEEEWTMNPTTERVYAYIKEHIAKHGYAPTYGEIMGGCGISSKSLVAYHLGVLVAWGKISRVPGKSRSITLRGVDHANP